MFSLVSAPFFVMFMLATFDPDETNSLLILKLFLRCFARAKSLCQIALWFRKAKNGRCLNVYVLRDWLLHIGLLVLSSLR